MTNKICLKQGASAQNALLLLLFIALQLAQGSLSAGLSPYHWLRQTQDFVKAVTSQNQHQTAPCSNMASPVKSRNSDSSQRRFPEQHMERNKGSSNTLERNKGSKKHVETHVETRQSHSLLNQHKASNSNKISYY